MARIILIEDNRDHLELMAYLLRSQGHVALSAGSAASGQTMVECCVEIDLVICDIGLGAANGIDLVRALRKSGHLQNIPLMAVSAGSMGQAQAALAAGFCRYLLKPIEPHKFLEEINQCLAGNCKALSSRAAGTLMAHMAAPQHATVLAVDDRSANLDLVTALLQPLGYRVITAGGVEEALACIRKEIPDLVLTDVHMGDGTGFDLIHHIRSDTALQHIPWLVTSATYLTMDVRAKDLSLDDSNFVLQPWSPQALTAKVRGLIQSGKARSTATARAGS